MSDQPLFPIENASDGVNFSCLQRFLEPKRGKDRRQPLCQHCLAGTRRADHQDVMSTCCCDLKSALGYVLSANVLEVEGEVLRLVEQRVCSHLKRGRVYASVGRGVQKL